MNYAIIGVIILGLYILHRIALRKAQRERNEAWMYVAFAAMILEAQARAARDSQRAKDVK